MIKERIDAIDTAKGIGIMLVVLGHSLPNTTHFCLWIYIFHVPLFFFLSGFTFHVSRNKNFMMFLLKRSKQLLLPSIYFTIITLCVSKILHLDFYSFTSLLYGLPHAMWFLPVLFITEMLYWPIGRIHSSVITATILLSCLVLGIFLFRSNINVPYRMSTVFSATFYYGIGNLTQQMGWLSNIRRHNKFLLEGVFIAFLLIPFLYIMKTNCSIQFWNNEIPQPEVIYVLLSLLGVFGVIIGSCLIRGSLKKVLIAIGKNTLSILCLHMLYLSLFRHYLNYTPDGIYILLENTLLILTLYPTILLINNKAPWLVSKANKNSLPNVSQDKYRN